MSNIRGKNTQLEMEIRVRLFAMGFRYRLHRKDLPGTPDIVFPKYGVTVFVHGCFWHNHGCHLSVVPQTRRSWWVTKLKRTAHRDAVALCELRKRGWRVLVIWECGIRRPKTNRMEALDTVSSMAAEFLNSTLEFSEIPCRCSKIGDMRIGR